MEQTKTILKKTWVVAALACVCCLLWGSAIPLIKTGYRLMQMDSADTASQIVFAGVRFALAGILVLIFASLRERKVLLPDRTVLKYAVPVCMAQTVCQYFFFYIGVAHTSGVKGAIITGLGNFIAILLSCLVFHKEKMTGRKMLGCILGFAGVVVINLMGNSLDAGFRRRIYSDRAVFLRNVHGADQYFFQKDISGGTQRNAVYHGRDHSVPDRKRDGRTSRKRKCCRYRDHLLSGNGVCGGLYTVVSAACLERCIQGSDLWLCKSFVQCDPVCTGSGRGTSGI